MHNTWWTSEQGAMDRGNMVVGVVEAVCFVCWYSQGVVMHCAVPSTFVDLEAMSSTLFSIWWIPNYP